MILVGERDVEPVRLEPAYDRVNEVVRSLPLLISGTEAPSPTRSSRDKCRRSPIAPTVRRSSSSK